MSSGSQAKNYPQNPYHGDVYEGMVYGGTLERWMIQEEFDAWYTSRSNFLRYEGEEGSSNSGRR